jgi:hypothetical protein
MLFVLMRCEIAVELLKLVIVCSREHSENSAILPIYSCGTLTLCIPDYFFNKFCFCKCNKLFNYLLSRDPKNYVSPPSWGRHCFYMSVFRQDLLWYSDVCPSVCLSSVRLGFLLFMFLSHTKLKEWGHTRWVKSPALRHKIFKFWK